MVLGAKADVVETLRPLSPANVAVHWPWTGAQSPGATIA
jgi:hypothetical protein